VTVLAISSAHLSLLSLARLDRRYEWTRTIAFVCVGLLDALLLYIVWFEPEGDGGLVYRILGILGIVLASITVLTPVLHKLSSAETDIAKIDAEIERLRARIAALENTKVEFSQSETLK
jgi:uncharacterized small protein (DUF1192 family)